MRTAKTICFTLYPEEVEALDKVVEKLKTRKIFYFKNGLRKRCEPTRSKAVRFLLRLWEEQEKQKEIERMYDEYYMDQKEGKIKGGAR